MTTMAERASIRAAIERSRRDTKANDVIASLDSALTDLAELRLCLGADWSSELVDLYARIGAAKRAAEAIERGLKREDCDG